MITECRKGVNRNLFSKSNYFNAYREAVFSAEKKIWVARPKASRYPLAYRSRKFFFSRLVEDDLCGSDAWGSGSPTLLEGDAFPATKRLDIPRMNRHIVCARHAMNIGRLLAVRYWRTAPGTCDGCVGSGE